jgi:hypothetical protein
MTASNSVLTANPRQIGRSGTITDSQGAGRPPSSSDYIPSSGNPNRSSDRLVDSPPPTVSVLSDHIAIRGQPRANTIDRPCVVLSCSIVGRASVAQDGTAYRRPHGRGSLDHMGRMPVPPLERVGCRRGRQALSCTAHRPEEAQLAFRYAPAVSGAPPPTR